MPATPIGLCSEALTLIGAGPIATMDGPDARSVAAKQLYRPALEEVLAIHRWRFATQAYELARLTDPPATRWAAAYQLPAGVLAIHGLEVGGKVIDFDRYRDQLHCDAGDTDEVIATLTVETDEGYWPPYFAAAMRLKLASLFAIAVAEDSQKAQVFEGKFVRQLAVAKTLDAQGRTAAKMPVGRLAAFVQGRP